MRSWEEELILFYDRNQDKLGYHTDDNGKTTSVFLPIRHGIIRAKLEITIDREGNFLSVNIPDKEDGITLVQQTTESSARSGNIASHLLHDRLDYVAGGVDKNIHSRMPEREDYEEGKNGNDKYEEALKKAVKNASDANKKHAAYLSQLKRTLDDPDVPECVKAIYCYTKNHNIISDIRNSGNEAANKMIGPDGYKLKIDTMLRFKVKGCMVEECWKDQSLMQWWQKYCEKEDDLRGIRKINTPYSSVKQIPSKIFATGVLGEGDGTKPISSNKDGGDDYTFRGRFKDPTDIMQMGQEDMQKIYCAMKWLYETSGMQLGNLYLILWDTGKIGFTFLDWTMDTEYVMRNQPSQVNMSETMELRDARREEFLSMIDRRIQAEKESEKDTDEFRGLVSLGLKKTLPGQTKGRLAVTEYNELIKSKYFENYRKWHTEGGWIHKHPVKGGYTSYYGLPSVKDMALLLFGREDKDAYLKLKDNGMTEEFYERMFRCIYCGETIPSQYVAEAVRRALRPLNFKRRTNHDRVVRLACSLVAKERKLGDVKMLNIEEKDRNYLFGRLFAVANHMEWSTFDENDKENRRTNAERMMERMYIQPASTWLELYKRIQPYKRKLSYASWVYYDKLIREIQNMFDGADFNNKSLNALFLLGYSKQTEKLFTKHVDDTPESEKSVSNSVIE